MAKLILGGRNILSPFTRENPPRKVLDIGTGTGAWVIDVADEFPTAELVRGIDLSPIQSEYVPPNVEFNIDDAYVASPAQLISQLVVLAKGCDKS